MRPHMSLLEHEAVAPVTVAAAGAASAEDVDVAVGVFATVAMAVAGSELRVAASPAAVFAADVETAVVGAAWVASVAAAVEAPGAALAGDVGGTVGAAAVGRASVARRSMAVWALPKSVFRKSSVAAPPDVVSTVTSASAPVSMVAVGVYGPWPSTKTRAPVSPNTDVAVTKDLRTVTPLEVREMTPFGRAAQALAAEVVVLVASNCVVSASVEVVPPVADLR